MIYVNLIHNYLFFVIFFVRKQTTNISVKKVICDHICTHLKTTCFLECANIGYNFIEKQHFREFDLCKSRLRALETHTPWFC